MTKKELVDLIHNKKISLRDVCEVCVDDFGYDINQVRRMKVSELIARLEKEAKEEN